MERIDLRGLEDVLGIYSPWSIKSARPNDRARTFDVHLEPSDRSRLFGFINSTKGADTHQNGSWHYSSFGKYRVVIHAALPGDEQEPALNYSTLAQPCFLGSPSRKYSHLLRQQVAAARLQGLTAGTIAELYQLDRAMVDTIAQDLAAAPSQIQHLAAIATELHPVWEKILRSEIPLNTQVLPLRLLLSKLQLGASKTKKVSELMPLVVDLRKFFLANSSILSKELEQIFGGAEKANPGEHTVRTNVKKLVLPGLGNPIWQELLKDKVQLNSSNIALNLLIAKQRTAFAHALQPGEKLAVVEIMRSYFLRNYRTLKAELLLLNRACAIREKTRYRLPDVEHTVWQQLLEDDTFLPSNHMAYKLLLARLRAQLRSAPSPAAQLDAAKRIREFIQQNHRSLKHELGYLLKHVSAA